MLGYFIFWLVTGGKLDWPIIKLLILASHFRKQNTFLHSTITNWDWIAAWRLIELNPKKSFSSWDTSVTTQSPTWLSLPFISCPCGNSRIGLTMATVGSPKLTAQLGHYSSFRILLPFCRTSWGVGTLNSAIFNSFHNRYDFGMILEGLQNFGWGLNPPPSERHWAAPYDESAACLM